MGQHWVQDCPTQGDPNFDRKRIRPPVGIPMTRLAKSDEGGLILPDGHTGTLVANEDAFAREILGLPTAAAAAAEPRAAAAAARVAEAEAGSTAAGQPGDSAAQVLLLDNKPHQGKEEPGAATTPTAVPHAASQLALPRLAGESPRVRTHTSKSSRCFSQSADASLVAFCLCLRRRGRKVCFAWCPLIFLWLLCHPR